MKVKIVFISLSQFFLVAFSYLVLFQQASLLLSVKASTIVQIGSKQTGSSASTACFGESTAISYDTFTAVVGGPTDSSSNGAIWIYTRNGFAAWSQQGGKITGTASGGQFGWSVAISANGNTIISGVPKSSSELGSAVVLTRSSSSSAWSISSTFSPSGASSSPEFGFSVAVSAAGNVFVIGGPYDSSNAGAIWIFTMSGQVAKLTGSSNTAAKMGRSVAISNDASIIVAGGPYDSTEIGAVWVFTLVSGYTYAQQGTKISFGTKKLQFGFSVALSNSGSFLATGAPYCQSYGGCGFIYSLTPSGYVFQQQLSPTDETNNNDAQFGRSVTISLDGKIAIFGGPVDGNLKDYYDYSTKNKANDGAIWVYQRIINTQNFTVYPKFVGSGMSNTGANFGHAVSIGMDGSIFAGGWLDSSNTGALWIYAINAPSCLSPGNTGAVSYSNCFPVAYNGSLCQATCNSGYNATGSLISICQSGTYVPTANSGTCAPLSCLVPTNTISTIYNASCPSILNSTQSCAPICQNNYIIPSGSLTITCNSGVLSNTGGGVCTAPPCNRPVDTSTIIYSQSCSSTIQSSTNCVPVCASGYSANASLSISCSFGNLSAPQGTCLPNPCSTPADSNSTTYSVTCPSPTMASNTSCTPTCKSGYVTNASLTTNCYLGNIYVPGGGVCNPLPCARPNNTLATIYAQANCPLSTKSGSVCLPSCNPGYYQNASLSMTCVTGNFTSPLGVCLPYPCTRPSDTTSTIYSSSCSTNVTSGTTCTPTCAFGYVPTGDLTVTCTAGSFSFTSATCSAAPCSTPTVVTSPLTLGSCSQPTIQSGYSCTFGCISNYVANNSLTITCNYGAFTNVTGSCIFDVSNNLCSQPTPLYPISVGNCTQPSYVNGSTCSLSCANGYSENFPNDFNLVCANKQLTINPEAACDANPCPISSLNLVGVNYGNCATNVPTNSSCDLACAPGYTLAGSLEVFCDAGSFLGPAGSCTPSPCYQPSLPIDLGLDVSGCPAVAESGTSCGLTCLNPQDTIFGDVTATCSLGSYVINDPYCIGIAKVYTDTTSSISVEYPLTFSPQTTLYVAFSTDTVLPQDLFVTNVSLDGIFAENNNGDNLNFTVPYLSGTNESVEILVYVSIPSMSITNALLSNFFAVGVYCPIPILSSACPNQIRIQLNSLVVVSGSGFVSSSSLACYLDGVMQIGTPIIGIGGLSVTCPLYFPGNQTNVIVYLQISNDGTLPPSSLQLGVPITLIGACESAKPGSIAGSNGDCICPMGGYDNGLACIPCANGFYQEQIGQTSCASCNENEDTNGATGSVSESACVCKATFFENPQTKKCIPCVTGMICPGDNIIRISPGYWRANNDSIYVIHCPGGSFACAGSQNSSSLCAFGYRGPICAECEAGFSKINNGFICEICPENSLNALSLSALVLLAIFIAVILIRASSTDDEESMTALERTEKSQQVYVGVLVKITLNYLQVLYYIGRLSANWSATVNSFYSIIAQSTLTPNFPSIQCAANWGFYERLIFIYLSPLFVIIILTIVYVIRHFVYRLEYSISRSDFQFALMLMLYQIHPMILLEVISSFPCENVAGTGKSYLKADFGISCEGKAYKTYTTISAIYLIVYIGGMIALVTFRLYANAKNGNLFRPGSNAYHKYSFFIKGYRQHAYFAEVVVLARKIVVVVFSVLANSVLQLVWGGFAIILSLFFNTVYQPYSNRFCNRLDTLALSALYATVLLGFQFVEDNGNSTWTTVLVLLINVIVIFILLGCCLKYLRSVFYSIWMNFISYLPAWMQPDEDVSDIVMRQPGTRTSTMFKQQQLASSSSSSSSSALVEMQTI